MVLPAILTKVELVGENNIRQDSLAVEHFEASLAVKRKIRSKYHVKVGHTLMGIDACQGTRAAFVSNIP